MVLHAPAKVHTVTLTIDGTEVTVPEGTTIWTAAQGAGIDILHFDQHLEHLGDHLGVGSHWISDPS